MTVVSDDLNDLEANIENLHQLLSTIVWHALDLPRTDNVSVTDRVTSLSIIARDMSRNIVDAMGACHTKVRKDRRSAA
jgi:hypothetical protein